MPRLAQQKGALFTTRGFWLSNKVMCLHEIHGPFATTSGGFETAQLPVSLQAAGGCHPLSASAGCGGGDFSATSFVIRSGKKYRYLGTGWFWFLVLQIAVQSMADRYVYVPLIGIIMASWRIFVVPLVNVCSSGNYSGRTVLPVHKDDHWNDETLFRVTVMNNVVAHVTDGRCRKGGMSLRALAMAPIYVCMSILALSVLQQHTDEAEKEYRSVSYSYPVYNLGLLLKLSGCARSH